MKTNFLSVKNWSWVLILLTGTLMAASLSDEQVIKEAHLNYKVNGNSLLTMEASSIDIKISTWDRSEVSVIAKAIYKGKPNDKMTDFLERFETEVANHIYQSSSELEITTDLDIPNKIQIGSKHIGVQIDYGRDELEIYYELKVPMTLNLDIKNSYRDLSLFGNHQGKVKINHYSGDFRGNDFDELNLTLKYGTARVDNVLTGNFELYEQELEIESLEDASIEAKYSKVDIDITKKLLLEAYESEFRFNKVDEIRGSMKYSRITAREYITALILTDIYESQFSLNKVGVVQILNESKYCEFEINEIQKMELSRSYEDEVTVQEIESFSADSKYLELNFGLLKEDLKIDGYESEILIKSISPQLEQFELDGKYNELELNTGGTPVNITANITYGDIEFDESLYHRRIYIKEDSKQEMKLDSKRSSEKTPTIELRGYELNAIIK